MNKNVISTLAGTVALTSLALGGSPHLSTEEVISERGWCDTLKSIGTLYKDSDNALLQEIKVFGRLQYQAAYVDGDQNSESYSTFRRGRIGAKVKFLNYFSVMARANMVNDSKHKGEDRDWGFQTYDEAQVSFDAGKAFGIDFLDAAKITYGLDKIEFGEDVHTSSKKIKTIERTAITGKGRGDNRTGIIIDLGKDNWTGTYAVYNADEQDLEKIYDDLGNNQMFYASSTFGIDSGDIILDFIYNPDAAEVDNGYGNKWVGSVAYRTQLADWDLALNAIVGDDSSNESFYGFVVQPSKFIIEDKLEVVGRYYYQGSDSETGISPNSRYARAAKSGESSPMSETSGDSYHSIYAGLNYYFCGDNAKIMTGIEYETLDGPLGGADATTLWSAVRFYF